MIKAEHLDPDEPEPRRADGVGLVIGESRRPTTVSTTSTASVPAVISWAEPCRPLRFSSKTLAPWRRGSPKISEVLPLRSPHRLSFGDLVYVWADGVLSKARPGRAHSCVLVLLGVRLDRAEELIALADSLRSLAAGNASATATQRPVAPSPIMSPGSHVPRRRRFARAHHPRTAF
ncbi:hypothetical protein ACFQ67_02070 [Streptomyces sp. NPDC056488]|uniref:hypothetical protein n=1 Tax=unclassified Streptomyces TaxID=2593676 RepID=UPI0036AE5B16